MCSIWKKSEKLDIVLLAPLKKFKRDVADMTVNKIKKWMIRSVFDFPFVEFSNKMIRDIIEERFLRLVAFRGCANDKLCSDF